METTPQTWIARLRSAEPPVLASSTQALHVLAAELESLRLDTLATTILNDPYLTLRTLLAANRREAGQASRETTTVRHALMVLGVGPFLRQFEALPTIESVLGVTSVPYQRVQALVHRARHVAEQARDFASLRHDRDPEEAAAAALLLDLPELLICIHAPDACIQLEEHRHRAPPAEAELAALGVTLGELQQPLAEALGVPELLRALMDTTQTERPRVFGVHLAARVASHFEHGGPADELDADLQTAAEWLHLARDELVDTVHSNAHKATQSAPRPQVHAPAPLHSERIEAAAREIGSHLDRTLNLHEMMMLVLNGIHEGVGLQRVLFALLSPDRSRLRARLWVGVEPDSPLAGCEIAVEPPNLFTQLLRRPANLWRRTGEQPAIDTQLGPNLCHLLGEQPFFATSLFVQGKAIGIIYADQNGQAEGLDADRYAQFKRLGREAEVGLANLAGPPR